MSLKSLFCSFYLPLVLDCPKGEDGGSRGLWDLELMKGKHKVDSEVSQRIQDSSSPSGYELHSSDSYTHDISSFQLANSSLRRRNVERERDALPFFFLHPPVQFYLFY